MSSHKAKHRTISDSQNHQQSLEYRLESEVGALDRKRKSKAQSAVDAVEHPIVDGEVQASRIEDVDLEVGGFVEEKNRDPITEDIGEVEVDDVKFSSVRLLDPRPEGLGMTYTVYPILDDSTIHTQPLELFSVEFSSKYYCQSQGIEELYALEHDIRRLIKMRHANLQNVYAVRLTMPDDRNAFPVLKMLLESFPTVTLQDLLEDCNHLREERARDFFGQILNALNVVHGADLTHCAITPRCIGYIGLGQKQVKLGRVLYPTALMDLHQRNSFGTSAATASWGEGRGSVEVMNSEPTVYSRRRDLHAVGVMALQMTMGLKILDHSFNVEAAIQSVSKVSPIIAKLTSDMIQPQKKQINCQTLLARLAKGDTSTDIEYTLSRETVYEDPRLPQSIYSQLTPKQTAHWLYPHQGIGPAKQASRWDDDWDKLAFLGSGSYGTVHKARHRIDKRIYAVKIIKVREGNEKFLREVSMLSRLSHRNIVRYHATWIEKLDTQSGYDSSTESSEHSSTDTSDDSGTQSSVSTTEDSDGWEVSSIQTSGTKEFDDSHSKVIHKSSDIVVVFKKSGTTESAAELPPWTLKLFIQMEFVEGRTLKKLINRGIPEKTAWKLFRQIVDALIYISSYNIIHRDIKPDNIFIDGDGNCKVGDFGLATFGLVAVDLSDGSPRLANSNPNETEIVGTMEYMAPEVYRAGNHSKADVFSLGVTFFEMNYRFSSAPQRDIILQELRDEVFPSDWPETRSKQKNCESALQRSLHDETNGLE